MKDILRVAWFPLFIALAFYLVVWLANVEENNKRDLRQAIAQEAAVQERLKEDAAAILQELRTISRQLDKDSSQ